jgi:hypothetical protein
MTDETVDPAALRATALAATPGPWRWFDYPDGRKLLCAESQAVIHCPDAPIGIDDGDHAYIAAFHPGVTLALLDTAAAYDALVVERDRLRETLRHAAPWVCPTCGPHIKIDEDACCTACGADATYSAEADAMVSSAFDAGKEAGAASIQAVEAERDALAARVAAAIPAMQAYARDNPRHDFRGVPQDPSGVHAWLVDAAPPAPVCAICGGPATCVGIYDRQVPADENDTGAGTVEVYACDHCCGHGGEDGRCRPVAAPPAPEGEK